MRILVSYFRWKLRNSIAVEKKCTQFGSETSRDPDLPVRKYAFTNWEFTSHSHVGAHAPDAKNKRH